MSPIKAVLESVVNDFANASFTAGGEETRAEPGAVSGKCYNRTLAEALLCSCEITISSISTISSSPYVMGQTVAKSVMVRSLLW